ncbi:MAG: hypothetical protein MJ222_01955 [Bacilli bacterium]|nr:hypothetical protein [Bacilli bacterium]
MKRTKKFLIFSSLILGSSLSCINNPIITAFASGEELVPSIDLTSPIDDLLYDDTFRESYLNGVYNFGTHEKCVVLNFFEYGFKRQYSTDYGLYVYVYNPFQSVAINEYGKNKIEIGFSHDDSEDAIEDIPYNKYDLTFVSKTITDEDRNKFYKFKVNVDEDFYSHLIDKEKRIYSVSGVEVQMENKTTATDLFVGSKFVYTGFGANCDGNSESTLNCNKVGLDTIELVLHGGYKRSGYINEALTQAKDLHYVYFEVPNKYERKYGSLYSIKFEGYRYDFTQPFYVWDTSKTDFGRYSQMQDWFYFFDPKTFDNTAQSMETSLLEEPYKLAYGGRSNRPNIEHGSDYLNTLPKERLFKTNDLYKEISANEVEERYFDNQNKIKKKIINISNELSIDDFQKQTGTSPTPSSTFLGSFLNFFYGKQTGVNRVQEDGVYWDDLECLVKIVKKESDSDGNTYFINKKDVSDFNNTFKHSQNNDSSLYLFRFDTSDYWAAPISEIYADHWLWHDDSQYRGYSAYMSAIIDFDIISLTFKGTRGMVVIPVCSSPINIFADITNPPMPKDDGLPRWVIILLSCVGVGVVCYVGYNIYNKVIENKQNKLDYNLKKVEWDKHKNKKNKRKE